MRVNDYSVYPAKAELGVAFAQACASIAEVARWVVAATDGIMRTGALIWNRLALRSRERAAISVLAGLESHTLKDIGIGRSEIRYLARETARRGAYDRSAARR